VAVVRPITPLLALLVLAGCGGGGGNAKTSTTATHSLDTSKVAQAIRDSIRSERQLKARVVCPSQVPQQKGYRFACLAVLKHGTTTFSVDQTDDQGHVTYVGH
jgi:hypothetical protein